MTAGAERAAVFLLVQNRLLREALARILDKKNDIEGGGLCILLAHRKLFLVSKSPKPVIAETNRVENPPAMDQLMTAIA